MPRFMYPNRPTNKKNVKREKWRWVMLPGGKRVRVIVKPH